MAKKTQHEHDKEKDRSDDDFILQANVIGVDPEVEPFRSVIVADQRNKFGRYLGISAIVILFLFFLINGYIQSSKNGRDLGYAKKQNSDLIKSVNTLVSINKDQNDLIKALQEALRQQNKQLAKAGFQTVRIPGSFHATSGTPTPARRSNGSTSPSGSGSPTPRPSSKPTPSPPPSSTPSPDPVNNTKQRVCSLTGICLSAYFEETNDQGQQAVRPAQVYRSGYLASSWYVVLYALADLGLALSG